MWIAKKKIATTEFPALLFNVKLQALEKAETPHEHNLY